jgi:hypothetical protein
LCIKYKKLNAIWHFKGLKNFNYFNLSLILREETKMYNKKGMVNAGDLTGIGLAVGVTVVVIVFMGLFAGSIYNSLEDDITAISSTTIQGSVQDSSESAFEALEKYSDLLPIVVLALMFAIALGVIVGSLYMRGGGTAL